MRVCISEVQKVAHHNSYHTRHPCSPRPVSLLFSLSYESCGRVPGLRYRPSEQTSTARPYISACRARSIFSPENKGLEQLSHMIQRSAECLWEGWPVQAASCIPACGWVFSVGCRGLGGGCSEHRLRGFAVCGEDSKAEGVTDTEFLV